MGTHLLGTRLAVAAGLLALAGCGGDAGSTPDTAATSSPPSPSSSATSSETPDEPTASAEVTPADGPLLDGGSIAVHAPEGWVKADGMVEWMHPARPRTGLGSIMLSVLVGGSGQSLDQLAAGSLKNAFPDNGRQLPHVTVDGVELYRIAGTEDSGMHVEEYGVDHDGDLVALTFRLESGMARAERDELIASVLASATWT